jgi:hypothetical protein
MYQENREDRLARSRKWRDSNAARQQNREKMRSLRRAQALEVGAPRLRPAVCDICGQKETAKTKFGAPRNLSRDHCHATGAFRGWLCIRCNMLLGKVNDDPGLLLRMAKYLKDGGAPF